MKWFGLMSLFLLIGCNAIDGNFTAHNNITLESQNGIEQVLVGQYKAKVEFPSKKRMVLSLNGNDSEFTFKIPKDTPIPDNGRVALTRDQVGQPYDIVGDVATAVTRGNILENWQSCTYQRPYTVCRTDARGNRTCWTEYRTEFGQQYVRYYMETVAKDFSFSLTDGGTSQAQFIGNDVSHYRRDIYAGDCR
ncbi:MAG: hypothetical protein COW00_01715 [Bdellovibrio sp. CG12_big_fil_rev_8_21_14_0_65_39_13]|nr:MAG: hypothetical protein COW78_03465 [Bdellovibrio sp. CG22_combo_CG10-13_8_21_14_all_39_27]PIQ62427.1 MAG: hypothetical protein COW00_01715 [Bdellovibrio sp. CG12_big_fil_rev_8_21_14_0_65_39_13]PIR34094.1 MAG: hypothetical protein COV37_14195 [Bdellovibrio sp. CG11_big_fil_rev_8_21_14_0_20_39_38]PJB53678.1 MAG: hypothetical protein CO099_05795 [Bdellovibrio sp. CG_4_9_14_3_um_filter_39_7]